MGSGPDRLRDLIDSHSASVANYLRRQIYPLPKEDLDDLVEDTFIVAWRRIDAVPEGEGERPWLIGVARNVLHNAQRSTRRRRRHESRIMGRGPSPSAEDEAVADLAGRAAMNALGNADREILALHYWDGLDIHEVAAVLSISANAAGTRLSRAKSRFLEQLASIEILGTRGTTADMDT
jgi:RNA polymerase sigma-70 factor (ECF subfamily)